MKVLKLFKSHLVVIWQMISMLLSYKLIFFVDPFVCLSYPIISVLELVSCRRSIEKLVEDGFQVFLVRMMRVRGRSIL